MTTTQLDATVLREGSPVCREALVVLRFEDRHVRVQLPGQAHYGYKPLGRHHPTIIRFLGGTEPELEAELRELAHGAMDNDVRKGHRNQGWAPAPIDLQLDDGRDLVGCRVQAPILGFGPLAELDFQLAHPPL
jgi:hypothetical protein